MKLLFFFGFLALSVAQNNELENAIKEVFSTPPTDFLSQFGEVVTKKPLESLTAIAKCGEGADQGVHVCVPYYDCDGKTQSIIQNGKADGFGVLASRFGDLSCDNSLEVCCKIP